MDKLLVKFLSRRRLRRVTVFMKLITKIGNGPLWAVLSVLFLFINIYIGIALIIALLSQIVLQKILKQMFHRKRPYVAHDDILFIMSPPDRFSFPSGHAAGAFVFVFVFHYLFPVLFIPMLILASIIAFSRMYLGLHYPSDILAGILLGFVCAKIGIFLAYDVLAFL
jgi:undecaprenyl-diphosphatase